MINKAVCFSAAFALFGLSCARSTVLLRGDRAREYLAEGNRLLTPGDYTVLEIADQRVGNLAAVIFNRDRGGESGGNFHWLKREKVTGCRYLPETCNILLLNTPDGKRGDTPAEELLQRIEEAGLLPVIVLGSAGEEQAVVYKRGSLPLNIFVRPDGVVRLELGRKTRESGNIVYTFKLK